MQTGWTVVDTHPTHGRTFQRPLNEPESGFFWDAKFNGFSDTLLYVHLRLSNGAQDAYLFSEDNIVRAWLSTKRRYPLVATTVQGRGLDVETGTEPSVDDDDAWELHYVVRERDIVIVRPNEIIFGEVSNAEEARKEAAVILDSPRPLSAELLAQLYIFREANSEDVLHVMMLVAHGITDGMSNRTIARCLVDTLARGGRLDAEPLQLPLEDRLAMSVAFTEQKPVHVRSLSLARLRWRKAIGAVIWYIMLRKSQGSHTLPRFRLRGSAYHTPTQSGYISTSLTPAQTTAVIAKCRQHKITFGNAHTVLAQVAMTRVIYRRYLGGEISEEEWEYRKKVPYNTVGPINMRPRLDTTWFEKGGGGEFMMSIGMHIYKLPFMSLGGGDGPHRSQDREHVKRHVTFSDGAPAFSDLLTLDRFLYRARLLNKQMTEFFNHPLLHEIVDAGCAMYTKAQKFNILQRAKAGRDCDENSDDFTEDLSAAWAPEGYTLGNIDKIFPLEYPLPSTDPLSPYAPVSHPSKAGYVIPPPAILPDPTPEAEKIPRITVEHSNSRSHPRPGEISLGAMTMRGQLNLFVFYDGCTFEEALVEEWLSEVKDGILWYLGQ